MLASEKESLKRFRTESKTKCDNNESEVENPASSGIKDPVESGSQDEESKDMQDFLVDLRDLG